MPAPEATPDDPATQRFDSTCEPHPGGVEAPAGFEPVAEIGRGGMGVIYRARDLSLDRDVAIKLLQEQFAAHSRTAAKFMEEARISAQLQHPGIPAIYTAGLLPSGRPWLAMKLIKGDTLAKTFALAERGQLLAIFESVCQAIGYAHSRDVIHRDLKPSNIMVGAFGEVQVMDWGLAKVLHEKPDATVRDPQLTTEDRTHVHAQRDSNSGVETQYGSFMGTPSFMPPEQAIGAIDLIDARSDVFGLGAILCVILTAQPPFVGSDAESTRQLAARGKIEDAYARLDTCGAEPDLIRLAKRCLAVDPKERPGNGTEVAAAIAAFRAESEARARRAEVERAEADVRAAEQRKRRRVTLAAAAILIGALAVGGAAAAFALNQYANRRESEARLVSESLGQLRALRSEAQKYRTDPVRGAPYWREVRLLLERSTRALPADPVDPGLMARARAELDDTRAELDDADRDRKLIAAIEAARERTMRLEEGNFNVRQRVQDIIFNVKAAGNYERAFRDYGVDMTALDRDEAVERLRARPITLPIALALDDWSFLDPKAAGGRLIAVSMAIDPDPDRNRVRELLLQESDPTENLREDYRLLTTDFAVLDRLPPRTQILLGFALRNQGLLNESVTVVERAVHRMPDDLWLNDVAGLFQQVKDPPDAPAACRFFRAVIALRPDLSIGYSNLANQLTMNGELAEAERLYRRSLEIHPGDFFAATALIDLKVNEYDLPVLEQMISTFRRQLPDSPTILKRSGEFLMIKQDFAGARAVLRDLRDRYPDYGQTDLLEFNIAQSEYFVHETPDRLKIFTETLARLLRDHPDEGLFLDACGQAESYLGRHDDAIRHLRQATRVMPGQAATWVSLARALLNAGKVEETEPVVRRALLLAPGWGLVRAISSRYHTSRGDSAQALAEARTAYRLNPGLFEVQHILLAELRAQGLLDEALPIVEKICQFGPTVFNWTALSEVAETLAPDRALFACERALALQPDLVTVGLRQANLLRYYYRDYARAEQTLREQLRLTPETNDLDRANLYLALANIARDREHFDEAIRLLREAQRARQIKQRVPMYLDGVVIETLRLAGRRREMIDMILATVRQIEQNYGIGVQQNSQYAGLLAQYSLHLLDVEAYAEAEVLARKALAIREYLEEPRWFWHNTRAMVGRALVGQNRYAEAEPYLQPGFRGLILSRTTIPDGGKNRIYEAGLALVKLFEKTGRQANADQLRAGLPRELAPGPRPRLRARGSAP